MKKLVFVAFVFLFIMLIGSIYQEYHQKDNTVTQTTNYTKYIKDLEKTYKTQISNETSRKLQEACTSVDSSFKCSANGLVLKLAKEFNGQFYKIEKSDEFFSSNYKITVYQIPVDLFSSVLPKDKFQEEDVPAINLADKEENRKLYESQKFTGNKLYYSIEVEGEIKQAYAGNYTANVTGSIATFDILQVFKNSDVLVVESTHTNFSLIILIIVVLIILLSASSFLSGNYDRKRKKEKKD